MGLSKMMELPLLKNLKKLLLSIFNLIKMEIHSEVEEPKF